MSYFPSQRPTTRVTLTDPNYWVDVHSAMTYGEMKSLGVVNADGKADALIAADRLLQAMIIAWNLDGDDGQVVPVDEDHLNLLSAADAQKVISAISGVVADEGKGGSSSGS